jgi:hypothetical protein
MSKQEPSGEVPVNISGSQGVQHGSGNIQNNHWTHKQPLDLAAMRDVLRRVSPHVAVTRLQELEHRDLVDFFAGAEPEDVSQILEIFYNAEEARVLTILADINRRKATELVSLISEGDRDPLNGLPQAAQEIDRKAASLRWTDPREMESLGRGYARRYKGGRVSWSDDFGVRTSTGLIDGYLIGASGCGVAIGDQESAPTSPYGTDGIRQRFQSGTVYSSSHGTFWVKCDRCHEDEGSSGDWLGFPVSIEVQNSGIYTQGFEGGIICSYFTRVYDRVAFAVRREVASVLPDQGWRPVSKETPVVSSYGWRGDAQHFEVKQEARTYETAVYSPKQWQHSPMIVAPEVWDYYSQLGAEKSWLGFPVTGEYGKYLDVGRQDFEGGMIYWRSGSDPICVRKAVDEFITQGHNIGYPVTEEHPVNSGESDSIQFFERGVVTCRDGKYEVWLRPDEKAAEPHLTATPNDAAVLPVANYDKLTVTSLSARLRDLPVERLNQLIEYEESHAARPDVIAMFEHHRPPEPYRRGRYFQPRPQQEG